MTAEPHWRRAGFRGGVAGGGSWRITMNLREAAAEAVGEAGPSGRSRQDFLLDVDGVNKMTDPEC